MILKTQAIVKTHNKAKVKGVGDKKTKNGQVLRFAFLIPFPGQKKEKVSGLVSCFSVF